MDKNRFLKALIAMTASLSFLFGGLFASANAVEAKELTNVITEISLLDGSDNTQTMDSEGVYNIRTGNAYKLRALFDLKAYNGNLEDGDYFTLDIPAPMDVYNNTLQLVDNDTKVNIATAVVTKTGLNQGGKVTITLKNLDQYKEATNSQVVKDVQGNFAASFKFTSDQTNTAIPFDSSSVQGTITHKYSSKTISGTEEGYENFAKAGGQASRTTWESPILASAGFVGNGSYVSNWRVRVNTGGQDYGKNLVLTDSLPTGAQYAAIRYIPETVTVYEAPSMSGGTSAVMGDFVKLVENTDYVLAWNDNYTEFTITFKDGSKKYFVTYQTTTPNDGSKVANQIGLTTEDGTVLTQRSNNTRTTMVATATSLVSGEISASPAYKIRINKTDSFTQAPVEGAVYTITQKDDTSNTQEVTTNGDGIAISTEFDTDKAGKVFVIKEKTAPAGYELDETEYEVTLGAEGALVNLQDVSKPAKVTIEATKQLTGRELTDGEFTFQLLNQSGTVVAEASNVGNAIIFADVEFKGAGNYNYSIKEVKGTVQGVTYDEEAKPVTIAVTSEKGVLSASVTSTKPVFNNTFAADPTSLTIEATKVLTGTNAPNLTAGQFSFTLTDKADSTKVYEATNKADGTITFENVTFDKAGTYEFSLVEIAGTDTTITYDTTPKTVTVTVVQNEATGELKALVTSDPVTIKNKYTEPSTAVTVSKVWVDADNQDGKRPENVTVQLLANGSPVGEKVTFTGTYTFENLAKLNDNGEAIEYTVAEDTVDGYTTTYSGDAATGLVITNTHQPSLINIDVTKNWDDANNQDGKRPESITVNLFAGDVKVDSQVIVPAADGTWTHSFVNKPEFAAGEKIEYRITEEAVTDYTSTVNGYTITNSHTPETVKVSGTKVWSDADNQDNVRPESITINVNDGETVVDSITVTAANDWAWESKELPKYRVGSVGEEVSYTVTETAVEGYTTEVTEKDGQYTVTNTHVPEKISVSGKKVWDDVRNKDGIRPTSITVRLYADGVEIASTSVTAANGWTYTFEGLDKFKAGAVGQEVVYTVDEDAVSGYKKSVNGFNITNSYKPWTPVDPTPVPTPTPNPTPTPTPKDPEGSTDNGKPTPKSSTDKSEESSKETSGKSSSKKVLPSTGEAIGYASVIGLAVLAVLGTLYIRSRRS